VIFFTPYFFEVMMIFICKGEPMNRKSEMVLRRIIESEVASVMSSVDIDEEDVDFQTAFGDELKKIFPTIKIAIKSANLSIEKNIGNDSAIKAALNKNPKLKKLAMESVKTTSSNRASIRVLERFEKKRLNEDGIVLPIIGLALGMPKIVEWMGIIIEKLGKRFGRGEKFGKNVAKIAHAWHDVYINILKSAIQSFWTGSQKTLNVARTAFNKEEKVVKKLTDKQAAIIAKAVYIAILLYLGHNSVFGTIKAISGGDIPMTAFETLVTILKGADLAEVIPATIGIILEIE
jgi:hypothetical protein